jgi:hypothetical protein
MDVTRRTLARALAATMATTAVEAQPPSAGSDDDKAAREQMRNSADQLAKVSFPMDTEPAFRFRA